MSFWMNNITLNYAQSRACTELGVVIFMEEKNKSGRIKTYYIDYFVSDQIIFTRRGDKS